MEKKIPQQTKNLVNSLLQKLHCLESIVEFCNLVVIFG